ncbi:MAG: UDP-N-acetylmuramoyl-tripeptide--D-alanyl-D-alanine ligase [Deltaproteobacteria bacterium]|nr:UDP-N-acetylmuramoyl-tripeptide--D-alanyl-D-alanine ligase [Deltaproteobacteria bacterium]
MPELRLREVASITGGRLHGDGELRITAVVTDSRDAVPGAIYVGLTGRNFDGAIFAAEALRRGCVAVVVERAVELAGAPHVLVSSGLRALGDLAAAHRDAFGIPIVGITGSAGKTGTREMTARILETLGPVLTNLSNHNNLVGVPQTLLRLIPEHRAAVVELGTSLPGEIARLTEICRPRIGVITLVAAAHTEGLGDVDGVAREKGALLRGLPEGGIAVVPSYDRRVLAEAAAAPCRVVRFGYDPSDDLFLEEEQGGLAPTARVSWRGSDPELLRLAIPGRHHLRNAAAALAVGCLLGVPLAEGCRRLATATSGPGRTRVLQQGRIRIIDDTYNANPASMAAALRLLGEITGGVRCAALGLMAELGTAHEAEHRAMGRLAASAGLDALAVVGPDAAPMAEAALESGMAPERVRRMDDPAACSAWLREVIGDGEATLLIKGSRRARMEQVLEHLVGGGE